MGIILGILLLFCLYNRISAMFCLMIDGRSWRYCWPRCERVLTEIIENAFCKPETSKNRLIWFQIRLNKPIGKSIGIVIEIVFNENGIVRS